jgi:hypothetical protein
MCHDWSLLKFVTYRKSGIRVYDLLESLNMAHLELTQKLEDTHSERGSDFAENHCQLKQKVLGLD